MIDLYRFREAAHRLILDRGQPSATIFLAGMGRSGTTWAGNIMNHNGGHRIMFEPFSPSHVREARSFEYIQYLNPSDRNPTLLKAARRILTGRVSNGWVNQDNHGLFHTRRIIKEIKCNLMLRWLREVCPSMPIVLIVRHPLAVAASWLKLGWGVELAGGRTDYEIIGSQQTLLDDFPVIRQAMGSLDNNSLFEKIIFEWSVFHLLPFRQFSQGELFLLVFENLILKPEEEVRRLFDYLEMPVDWDRMSDVLRTASRTNYLNRDATQDKIGLLNDWKSEFSEKQMERAHCILSMFSLRNLYDEAGKPSGGLKLREQISSQ